MQKSGDSFIDVDQQGRELLKGRCYKNSQFGTVSFWVLISTMGAIWILYLMVLADQYWACEVRYPPNTEALSHLDCLKLHFGFFLIALG